MADKTYIGPTELLHDSFALAARIHASGFRPDVLLVIWRGGSPIGIVIHEYFRYKGVETFHAALKSESYTGIESRSEPRIEQLEPLLERIEAGSRVLLIDDIFDTGHTIHRVCGILRRHAVEVRVATLYYKEHNNRTDMVPDYFMRKTADWIVFPHEIMDLTPEEIRCKDPFIDALLTGNDDGGAAA